jgi:pimeloyl-ACP methyl ester carboxylesterase
MKKDYVLGLSEEGFHKMAYTEWGKANNTNTPIMCVHGLTRNGRDFDSLAAYMRYYGAHVFCPDIVGRGESDWLKNPIHYTYEQYIADMNVLIGRAHAQQVDWIGTSLGGLIGMVMASQPNTPIRKLVLNDIGPQIPQKGIARLSMYAGRDPEFKSMKEAQLYFQEIHAPMGKLSDKQWRHITEHSVREISPGRFVSKVDHNVKLTSSKSHIAWRAIMHPLKAFEGTLFDVDLWQIWRKIRCPVLVIHGKQSDILLSSVIQKMRVTHPETEVIEIPHAGHAPALFDETEHEAIYRWLMK